MYSIAEKDFSPGMDYSLYDTVLFYNAGEAETYVGKIVKIFETADHVKKVKIVWFFRPSEIQNYLGDYKPSWNELFLASGNGPGVSNINLMEAIVRKCLVVSVSTDPRNPTSKAERRPEYIFRMTFDVGARKLSEKFPDKIDGVRGAVERFFNSLECQIPHKQNYTQRNTKRESARCFSASDERPYKKMKQEDFNDEETKSIAQKCPKTMKMENFKDVVKKSIASPLKKQGFSEQYASSQRPSMVTAQLDNIKRFKPADADSTKWFKPPEISWKERLETAQKQGTLVLLENLDPSCTSSEVEEIVLSALKENVKARMIPQNTFSVGVYGEAFVIFSSKDAAKTAVDRLNQGCLMLSDQRPVVARRGVLKEPETSTKFPGHYQIKQKRVHEYTRTAIATGHCAQHNTIEYTMAMDWWVRQEKMERAVKALHAKQKKEMRLLKLDLQINSRIFRSTSDPSNRGNR